MGDHVHDPTKGPTGPLFLSVVEKTVHEAGQLPAPAATERGLFTARTGAQMCGRTLDGPVVEMPRELVTELAGDTLHWVPVAGVGEERGPRA